MERHSHLQAILDRLTERNLPGVSAVVVRRGSVQEAASAGVADLETGAPATPATVYLWFSMTKIVTATAVMQLGERGALSLDDPVDRFLPSWVCTASRNASHAV